MRYIGGVAIGILLALAAATPASAADPQERAAKQALERAQRALRGEFGPRGVTLALRGLAVQRRHLRGADARRARALLERPTDPGGDGIVEYQTAEETPVCGDVFCIHYVSTTEDAPDLTDEQAADGSPAPGGNGVPDYIDEMLREFEFVGRIENALPPAGLGWVPPIPDDTAGGGQDLFDVYVAEIGQDCCFGYANPEPPADPDDWQWPAYMVMDDDYAIEEFGYDDPTVPLQVTAAHEYSHVLQFAIDSRFDVWIGESVATWMEEKVYPDGDDWQNYIPRWATMPEVPLTFYNLEDGGDPANIKPYGSSVFIHWLSDRYSDRAIRDAFEALISTEPAIYSPAAFDDALALRGGTSLGDAFGRFAAATAEWRTPAAGIRDGDELRAQVRREGALRDGSSVTVPIDHTAMRMYDVPPNGADAMRLTVNAPADTASSIALVGRRGPVDSGELVTRAADLPAGGTGSVVLRDFSSFDRVTAVLVNTDTKVDPASPFVEELGVFDWRYQRDGGSYTASVTSDVDGPPPPPPPPPPAAAPPPPPPATAPVDIRRLTASALRLSAGDLVDALGWRGKRTLLRRSARFAFDAPAPGRLTVTLRAGSRRLGSATRRVMQAGTVRGRLRASRMGKRYLRRTSRVRARVIMRFTPTAGVRTQITRRVTLTR